MSAKFRQTFNAYFTPMVAAIKKKSFVDLYASRPTILISVSVFSFNIIFGFKEQ